MGKHVSQAIEELNEYGFSFHVENRSEASEVVQKAFLKDDSWGKLLSFQYYAARGSTPKKLQIKVEVDTNPPVGSSNEEKVLPFPFPFTVLVQDLPSLFAGKCHALLCRRYVKGRDWYDFLWYARKKIQPNFIFLKSALLQNGPWKGKKVSVDLRWFLQVMEERIDEINWTEARRDIQHFLRNPELRSLHLWSADFFKSQLKNIVT